MPRRRTPTDSGEIDLRSRRGKLTRESVAVLRPEKTEGKNAGESLTGAKTSQSRQPAPVLNFRSCLRCGDEYHEPTTNKTAYCFQCREEMSARRYDE